MSDSGIKWRNFDLGHWINYNLRHSLRALWLRWKKTKTASISDGDNFLGNRTKIFLAISWEQGLPYENIEETCNSTATSLKIYVGKSCFCFITDSSAECNQRLFYWHFKSLIAYYTHFP